MLVDATSLLQRLQQQPTMTVLTEAEILAENRVPTFRVENGFERRYRPEPLATRDAFKLNPALVAEQATTYELFTIRTSSQVFPAAAPVQPATDQEAFTVESNPEITSTSPRIESVSGDPPRKCSPK